MSTDYVAGSLSALFGKKSSKSDDVPVKLKHVKQMYEEFTPLKKPRVVGNQPETPQNKRKSAGEDSLTERLPKRAKSSASKHRTRDGVADSLKENVTAEPSDNPDGEDSEDGQELTNKQAALKRIKRKTSLKEKKVKEAKGMCALETLDRMVGYAFTQQHLKS